MTRRTWGAQCWRYSWLVTLPLVLLFGVWLQRTYARHRTFRVEHVTLEDFNLRDVGAMEAGAMLRRLEVDWTRIGDGAPLPALRTLDLFVAEANLAALDRDLPHSGFEFVDAQLAVGGRSQDVEVRYRGDNVYHWGYAKKSFRIKTRKNQPFEGLRAFNLIAPRTPELLNNYLAYRLAAALGLIAPRVELVEVRVNGKVRGVHVLTEQLDENSLRAHGRLPGDLWSGDAVAMRAHVGIANDLFRYPALWEKQVIDPRFAAESTAPLTGLLACLRAPASDARQTRLAELCDYPQFAAFALLEILCATIHVDTEHNWRLYYDADRRRFQPVVWDLFGWDAKNAPAPGHAPRLDVLASPLHVVLHGDGEFLRARQAAVVEFFAAGSDRRFLAEIDRAIAAVTPALARDPNLCMQVRAYRPTELLAAMANLRRQIGELFAQIRAAYLEPHAPVEFWRTPRGFAVAVGDRVGVSRLRLGFATPVAPGALHVQIRRGGEIVTCDVSAAATARGCELDLAVPLLPRFVLQVDTLRTFEVKVNRANLAPASYEFVFAAPLPELLDLRVERAGVWQQALPGAPRQLDLGDVWRVVRPEPLVEPEVWRGVVELSGTTELRGPLRIEPGTTVRLAAGASLVLRARLTAHGTAAAPIRFLSASSAAWGALTLLGDGADGSLLRHCVLQGGGGSRDAHHDDPALLNVNGARGVVLEQCALRDAAGGDDLLRAVYAEVTLRDCRLQQARADAVDLDLSTARLERCSFEECPQDGLDLYRARVELVDCRWTGCGERAVAVGEGSAAFVARGEFVGGRGGSALVVEDGGAAAVCASEFTGYGRTLVASGSSWRFAHGGRLFAYGCQLTGHGLAAAADQRSAVVLRGCTVAPPASTGPQVQVMLGDPVERLAEERALLGGLGDGWWSAR